MDPQRKCLHLQLALFVVFVFCPDLNWEPQMIQLWVDIFLVIFCILYVWRGLQWVCVWLRDFSETVFSAAVALNQEWTLTLMFSWSSGSAFRWLHLEIPMNSGEQSDARLPHSLCVLICFFTFHLYTNTEISGWTSYFPSTSLRITCVHEYCTHPMSWSGEKKPSKTHQSIKCTPVETTTQTCRQEGNIMRPSYSRSLSCTELAGLRALCVLWCWCFSAWRQGVLKCI